MPAVLAVYLPITAIIKVYLHCFGEQLTGTVLEITHCRVYGDSGESTVYEIPVLYCKGEKQYQKTFYNQPMVPPSCEFPLLVSQSNPRMAYRQSEGCWFCLEIALRPFLSLLI